MQKMNWKKVIGFIIVVILVGFGVLDPVDLFTQQTSLTNDYTNNRVINQEACSLSGKREANVKVDIGYGDREYYAYTNEVGQLVYVEASEIRLQTDDELAEGKKRYCNDEAKVPGTESSTLDEGHVIADSLGGVGNAYNITPQDSYTNRNGAQAEMERFMRETLYNNGVITDFKAVIEYDNLQTQTPSYYSYEMIADGQYKQFDFANESE
ncbi:MAG: DNA/RNA non-specific endonuclease [Culicoidibacterales bacterium]